MALPTNITRIKIHPAIGIARQSPNEDYFIFGQQPAAYKSNNLIKRQAVQFTLVGYNDQNAEVEELTLERLTAHGLRVVWSADVANWKQKQQHGNDPAYAVTASARSDQNNGQLIGQLEEFEEGSNIPLGQITPAGLFIPPLARVFKKDANEPISNKSMHSNVETDNTCDGKISAALYDEDGTQMDLPVLPAWIIVAPPDFSPDALDSDVYPQGADTLEDYLVNMLALNNVQPMNRTALDREMLRQGTGEFLPGVETSLGDSSSSLPQSSFYDDFATGDAGDIRVRPFDGQTGAQPGELTQGLCSPWQFDFVACTCSYWAAQRPDKIYQSQGSSQQVHWLRKRVSDTSSSEDSWDPDVLANLVKTNQEMVEHVHKLGIARGKTGGYETERTNDIP